MEEAVTLCQICMIGLPKAVSASAACKDLGDFFAFFPRVIAKFGGPQDVGAGRGESGWESRARY
jgi:hypothetical protein